MKIEDYLIFPYFGPHLPLLGALSQYLCKVAVDDFCCKIVTKMKIVTFFLVGPPYILSSFARTSKDHKNITKGRRNILRPVLESLWSILSEYDICINKIMNFDAFL